MGRWLRRTHHQAQDRQSTGVPSEPTLPFDSEFDAYLAGGYAEWSLAHGQSVPAWAWMNRIAHASLVDLRATTDRSAVSENDPDLVPWELTTRFLIQEVLATATDDEALHELQQRVLVPVELGLAKEWWRTLAPKDLATLVMVALQDAQRPQ